MAIQNGPITFFDLQKSTLEWLGERYQSGRVDIDGFTLQKFLEDATNFRRKTTDQAELRQLSSLTGVFMAVLSYLVDGNVLTVDPSDENYTETRRPRFNMKFRLTPRVLDPFQIREAARLISIQGVPHIETQWVADTFIPADVLSEDDSVANTTRTTKTRTKKKPKNFKLIEYARKRFLAGDTWPQIAGKWFDRHNESHDPDAIRMAVARAIKNEQIS